MRRIVFSQHALEQMADRGAGREEVESAVRDGELMPARGRCLSYRKNLPFNQQWKGITASSRLCRWLSQNLIK